MLTVGVELTYLHTNANADCVVTGGLNYVQLTFEIRSNVCGVNMSVSSDYVCYRIYDARMMST